MNLYLDGCWLADGIGATGIRRFSADLNDAMVERVAGAPAAVVSHVFSVGRPVEARHRRPNVRYCVVPAGYRFLLWANALIGRPDLTRAFDPAADRIHIHDAVRFAGGGGPHTLVTVHDLAAMREPATYPARATWLRRQSMKRLRDSDAVVHAVSEATRADVIELGAIPPERVHTVEEGVRPEFFATIPVTERSRVLTTLGLDRPFVMFIGGPHPRKNLAFLVRCFRDVLDRGREVLLALIGPQLGDRVDGWCSDAGYTAAQRSRVRWLGALPDESMRACLQASWGLCFPSLYEGFGLPVLEAMASGTPVIASDRSSLPEVVGDAGLLRDPGDPEAWIEGIDALVTDPGLRRALAARGRARAADFTWERAATRLLALLEVPLQ